MLHSSSARKRWLYFAILVGFIVLESPLILMANHATPFVLGLPFFLFWNLLWWAVLTLLFLVGYLTHWGSGPAVREGEQ